jgi:hypothetical protein
MLIVTIRDYFDMLDGPSDSEYLCEHVLRDARAEIPNVKMSTPLGGRIRPGSQ